VATTSCPISEAEPIPDQTRVGNQLIQALCVASLFAVLNFVAATPFYPDMSTDLSTTVSRLGQLVTIMVVISAVMGIAIGPLSDRYGYRRPLVAGIVAIGINLIGSGLTPSFLPLVVLGIVGGLADSLVFGMPMAIIGARLTGDAQRKAISWTWGAYSAGGIIGVPAISLIGGIAGWRTALIVTGMIVLAGALYVAIAVPPDQKKEAAPWRTRDLLESYLPLLKDSPTLRLFGVSFLRAACWIGLLTYLGSFLQDEIGLSVSKAGLVYMVGGTGFALGSLVAGRRIQGVSPRILVALVNLVGGLSVGGMLLISNVWASLPLLFTTGFAFAISGVAIATILAVESPAGSGTTMVLNSSLLNFGTATGAGVGGVLIAVGGYSALGIGFALFAFAGAALACWPSNASRVVNPLREPVSEPSASD
jgi:MFS transporter, DHA1 family, inner membrane transport protein